MTTNYEKIKNMTIEEMANCLTNLILNTIAVNSNKNNIQLICDVMQTYNSILKSLQSESEVK